MLTLIEKKKQKKFNLSSVASDSGLEKFGNEPGRGDLDKNLVSLLKPQSFEAEQFKILRTHLLYPATGKSPRSIMVTSAVPGEGKSFVAANLAVSIAQNINEHVLLIDCDLRKSSVHNQFGFSNVKGLSEYLTDSTSLSSIFLKVGIDKLTVLPAGVSPTNPAELLSSEKMAQLLKEVTNRYKDRYIIIDSPPPHLTAETRVIASQVDGIILVVKTSSTKREVVKDLVEKLGKEKILGIVANWFDLRSSMYYGYSKYGKYRKDYANYHKK